MIERPDVVEEEHLLYLDDLRESGDTNMFGAAQDLQWAFSYLSKQDARIILKYWMDTFGNEPR